MSQSDDESYADIFLKILGLLMAAAGSILWFVIMTRLTLGINFSTEPIFEFWN